MADNFRIGIYIGSTTVNVIVLDNYENIVFKSYERHLSDIKNSVIYLLKKAYYEIGNKSISVVSTVLEE